VSTEAHQALSLFSLALELNDGFTQINLKTNGSANGSSIAVVRHTIGSLANNLQN